MDLKTRLAKEAKLFGDLVKLEILNPHNGKEADQFLIYWRAKISASMAIQSIKENENG